MNLARPFLLVAWFAVAGLPALARDYQPTLPAGETCEVPLAALRPTQFCVGEIEVRQRAKKLAGKSPEKLDAYLAAHVVPVVIGPGGAPFLIDHHHLALALQETGLRPTVPAKIMENWSALGEKVFWQKMRERKWVYLFRRGEGPLDPSALPKKLSAMTDDPYRSLVWAARQEDPDFARDEAPFSEFKWADYFRQHIPLDGTKKGFRQATEEAARLMGAKRD